MPAVFTLLAIMTWYQPDAAPESGIAQVLAQHRAGAIRNLRYELAFDVPATHTEPVRGRERVRFDLSAAESVVLDFSVTPERLLSVSIGGAPIAAQHANGHIVLPRHVMRAGENVVDLDFLAGDVPLNRSAEFLYTLFVPARASQTFPCFDQPDLKARFSLTVSAPSDWQLVANGEETGRTKTGDRVTVRFAETEPLPTYLFSFVAGKFLVEEAERNGRRFRMFHRETDAGKVARNRDAIFDLHAAALTWLEEYTGLPYAFGKFDFILIPSFQFNGMEHAGAILYNAPRLLLEATATQDQALQRARVIAHETSHMWFGNLVTMRWFDDVWMKEVFANFMAAKIVNPSFAGINHELRFLLTHYPAAYEVDRTAGTNAIRQELANLTEAGSLYGAIIYEKAPTVMRQLEERMGAERLRAGLREYLKRYQFANASWPDLIGLLDQLERRDRKAPAEAADNSRATATRISRWSQAWVSEEGRPIIRTELRTRGGRIARLAFMQTDPYPRRGLTWPQRLHVTLGYASGERTLVVDLDGASAEATEATGLEAPLYILPNGRGRGYGQFILDPASLAYLTAGVEEIPDALTRGSAWVTLWDAMLDHQLTPAALADAALRALPREGDELLIQRVLGYLANAYWRFLSAGERLTLAARIESIAREGLARSATTSLRSAWFSAFRGMTLTPEGIAWLERVWRREEPVAGLTLSENDEIEMAQELAVRGVPAWRAILDEQLRRIGNPDRKARFAFVSPALSSDVADRDRFVAALADPANRRREPWVLDGLRFVHHALRAHQAERHILPALGMVREIQRTGDIFFPKRWADAVLSGHSSASAAASVRRFVEGLAADYPPRLRKIILSAADDLFRAAKAQSMPPSASKG